MIKTRRFNRQILYLFRWTGPRRTYNHGPIQPTVELTTVIGTGTWEWARPHFYSIQNIAYIKIIRKAWKKNERYQTKELSNGRTFSGDGENYLFWLSTQEDYIDRKTIMSIN